MTLKLIITKLSDKLGGDYLDQDDIQIELWGNDEFLCIEIEGNLYMIPKVAIYGLMRKDDYNEI